MSRERRGRYERKRDEEAKEKKKENRGDDPRGSVTEEAKSGGTRRNEPGE